MRTVPYACSPGLRSADEGLLARYSLAVHVIDVPTGERVAQGDVGAGPGAFVPLRSEIDISALPAGDYEVHLALYDWQTGARLPARDPGDGHSQYYAFTVSLPHRVNYGTPKGCDRFVPAITPRGEMNLTNSIHSRTQCPAWLWALLPLLLAAALSIPLLGDDAFTGDEPKTLFAAGVLSSGPHTLAGVLAAITEKSSEQALGWPFLVFVWGRLAGWSEPPSACCPSLPACWRSPSWPAPAAILCRR